MEQVVWGYVRVSTREQNEDRQMIAMSEFDVPRSHIYMDKMSGKDFERPAYRKLLKRMKAGHLLVMTRFWSSGVSSPKKKRSRWWCSICLF